MASTLLSAKLGSEFDAFLFAVIGEEINGGQLSTISMLARLDLDPWQESVRLDQLSLVAATKRLTALIRSLPGDMVNRFKPEAIAERLAGLLPHRSSGATPSPVRSLSSDGLQSNSGLLIGIVFVLVWITSQWVASNKDVPRVDAPASYENGAVHSEKLQSR